MKGRTFRRLGLTCAGVLAGCGALAAPALAAPAGSSRSAAARPAAPTPAAPAKPAALPTSPYFGGFDVTPAESLSSDGVTFTLPKNASCASANDYEDIFLGEEADVASGSEQQPGGETDAAADVIMLCAPGEGVSYYLEAYATAPDGTSVDNDSISANPGDVIETSIEFTNGGETVVTALDQTTGQEETAQDTSPDSSSPLGLDTQWREGAVPNLAYEENNCSYLGVCSYDVPKFTTIGFKDSQVGSQHLYQLDPAAYSLAQDGPVQITPSALKASHPGGFTLTEKHDY